MYALHCSYSFCVSHATLPLLLVIFFLSFFFFFLNWFYITCTEYRQTWLTTLSNYCTCASDRLYTCSRLPRPYCGSLQTYHVLGPSVGIWCCLQMTLLWKEGEERERLMMVPSQGYFTMSKGFGRLGQGGRQKVQLCQAGCRKE